MNFKNWLISEEQWQNVVDSDKHGKDSQDYLYQQIEKAVSDYASPEKLKEILNAELKEIPISTTINVCMKTPNNSTVGDEIIKSGFYKNLYETGVTVGVDMNQYGREYQITQHLGDNPEVSKKLYENISDEVPDEHKPKYAGFMWHGDHLGNAAGTFDSTQTTIVWKFEAIKNNITIAAHDTLEVRPSGGTGTKTDANLVGNIKNPFHVLMRNSMAMQKVLFPALIKLGIPNITPELRNIYMKVANGIGIGDYSEVHIWGKLPINSNTVEKVIIGTFLEGESDDNDPCQQTRNRFSDWLKSLNIPVLEKENLKAEYEKKNPYRHNPKYGENSVSVDDWNTINPKVGDIFFSNYGHYEFKAKINRVQGVKHRWNATVEVIDCEYNKSIIGTTFDFTQVHYDHKLKGFTGDWDTSNM